MNLSFAPRSGLILLAVLSVAGIAVVQGFAPLIHDHTYKNAKSSSSTSLNAFGGFLDFLTKAPASLNEEEVGISKSTDPDYPQLFTGRLWFSPSLVKVPSKESSLSPGPSVSILSLFGYSLGGTVTLEYDTSPVGPYREYVTMSALVSKRGTIGQWGSRLYVSTQKAEDVCKDIWGVPAELANIEFCETRENGSNKVLQVTSPPNPGASTQNVQNIRVEGWENTRVLTEEENDSDPKRNGGLPVFWTPTIKALWAPFIPLPASSDGKEEEELPMHKLRLSASALRLYWSGFQRDIQKDDYTEEAYNLGIPIPIGLIVDNVLIEIGTRCESDL